MHMPPVYKSAQTYPAAPVTPPAAPVTPPAAPVTPPAAPVTPPAAPVTPTPPSFTQEDRTLGHRTMHTGGIPSLAQEKELQKGLPDGAVDSFGRLTKKYRGAAGGNDAIQSVYREKVKGLSPSVEPVAAPAGAVAPPPLSGTLNRAGTPPTTPYRAPLSDERDVNGPAQALGFSRGPASQPWPVQRRGGDMGRGDGYQARGTQEQMNRDSSMWEAHRNGTSGDWNRANGVAPTHSTYRSLQPDGSLGPVPNGNRTQPEQQAFATKQREQDYSTLHGGKPAPTWYKNPHAVDPKGIPQLGYPQTSAPARKTPTTTTTSPPPTFKPRMGGAHRR